MVTTEISQIFESTKGSTSINVFFPDRLEFSKKIGNKTLISCKCAVTQAVIWRDNPNITTSNNTFEILQESDTSTFTLTFASGLYDLQSIQKTLSSTLINLASTDTLTDSACVQFEGIDATGKIRMIIKAGFKVNFDVDNSFGTILGFEKDAYPSAFQATTYRIESTSVASLNNISSYYINAGGLVNSYVNGKSGSIVAVVDIPNDVSVGGKITYLPPVPSWFEVPRLVNNGINNVSFELSGNSNLSVSTNEIWSFTLTFKCLYA